MLGVVASVSSPIENCCLSLNFLRMCSLFCVCVIVVWFSYAAGTTVTHEVPTGGTHPHPTKYNHSPQYWIARIVAFISEVEILSCNKGEISSKASIPLQSPGDNYPEGFYKGL